MTLNIYKNHNVEIEGMKYLCKYNKSTNKPMYKRRFSICHKSQSKSFVTKEWQTSISKVNREVEDMRTAFRRNIEKGIQNESEKQKHLYEDIVEEMYKNEVQNCINHNKSFQVIEKFYSNSKVYVLNGDYPNFKNRFIEDITIHEIKQLKKDIITQAMKTELSVLTVGHIFSNIDRAFRYAGEKSYIDDTISENIHITPKGKKRKKMTLKNFLLKNEFDEFMKVFDGDIVFSKRETKADNEFRKKMYYTFLNCAFLLGFRRSEGFGLRWKDFNDDKISINSSLNIRYVKKHYKTITSRFTDPKTESSIREMKTPKSVKILLNNWKKYCEKLNIDTSDEALIFVEANGYNLTPTTFRNRFIKIIETSNIEKRFNKKLHLHSFRHSCCSFLVQKMREADKEISLREIEIQVGKYLGHSGGNMVHEVYMHLYPENDDSLINQVLNDI